MRIKEIKCEQFAGLRDRDYSFDKGLNLVIGDNESGKSTLVDLLYQLFFQEVKIGQKTVSDQEFTARYFPKSTGAFQGDTIDGTLKFETDAGTFKLTKEWSGKYGSAKLTMPDGTTIRDAEMIHNALSEVLVYGKGVYDELLFASQRRTQSLLKGLLGNKRSDNVDELAATLALAVMETGGIALDEMEAELSETVAAYEGRWDFAADMPEGGRKRGITNKWKQGAGSILNAYYRKEEIAAARDAAETAEREVDTVSSSILLKKQERDRLRSCRDRFSKVRSLIAAQNANRQLLISAEAELREMKEALLVWPEKEQKLHRAGKFAEELRQAKLKERVEAVSALMKARAAVREKLTAIGDIQDEEVKTADSLMLKIPRLEAKLKGMNLTARIRRLGSTEVKVTSVTGIPLETKEDALEITEAVDICVPGVVEIQLAPKGIDVEAIQNELDAVRARFSELLARYGADSLETLKERQQETKELKRELDGLEDKIRSALEGTTWEALSAQMAELPAGSRSSREIAGEISALTDIPLESFIGRLSGDLERYAQKYGKLENLSDEKERRENKVAELRRKAENGESMPAEFADVADPDAYDDKLKRELETIEVQMEQLGSRLSAAEKDLGERSAEEYNDEYQRAVAEFERQKEDYAHWSHILTVFRKIKDECKGDPLEGLAQSFRENLSVLSQGTISLNAVHEDLSSTIASGSNRLTVNTISDGTKDTIELAFRLAVLKHLYPNGGCVAVFDDPFTDMDPKRTEQACRLIQEFSENNQVIFTSCDEKYKCYLNGKVIEVTR